MMMSPNMYLTLPKKILSPYVLLQKPVKLRLDELRLDVGSASYISMENVCADNLANHTLQLDSHVLVDAPLLVAFDSR